VLAFLLCCQFYSLSTHNICSSNFSFPPGIGLPGRVLSSGQPLWDDSIPESSQMKFPRVEGAKTHGIKKGVGIPLYHTSFGKVVIALYSTQERTQNIGLVQKCCQLFQGSQVGKMVSHSFCGCQIYELGTSILLTSLCSLSLFKLGGDSSQSCRIRQWEFIKELRCNRVRRGTKCLRRQM
jgi:hypothetical protein